MRDGGVLPRIMFRGGDLRAIGSGWPRIFAAVIRNYLTETVSIRSDAAMNIHIAYAVPALVLGLLSPAAIAQSLPAPAGSPPVMDPGGFEGRNGLSNSLRERQHGVAPNTDLTTGSVVQPGEDARGSRAAPNRWRGIERYWKGNDLPLNGDGTQSGDL